MARRVDICLVLAMSLAASVTPALARAPASQATDPSSNSPAGVVYSIPLDSARQDAAPDGHSGQNTGSGGAVGGGSGGTGGSGGGTTGSGAGTAGSGGGTTGSGAATGSGPAAGSGNGSRPSGHGASRDVTAVGTAAAAAAGSSGGVPILVPGGQPGSLIHSSNGFGSSSNVPGLDAPPDAGLGAVQGNAGSAPLLAIVLAIIVLAIGAFAGLRAWPTPTRDQPAEPSSSA